MKKRIVAFLLSVTIIVSALLGVEGYASISDAAEKIPERYDLRELGLVTPVRNQAGYPLCWAFATTAAMESNALVRGYGEYDLSELQIAYMITHKFAPKDSPIFGEGLKFPKSWTDLDGHSAGGQGDSYSSNLLRGYAIITEDKFPLGQEYSGLYTAGASLEGDLYVDSVYMVSVTDRTAIKGLIMKNGAVCIDVNASSWKQENICNTKTGAAYLPKKTEEFDQVNHAVVIVGWDDNYSRDNFLIKPASDGAWIIKNSWGTDNGDNGYYYLSYSDAFLQDKQYGAWSVTVRKDRNYDRVYQYDGGIGYYFIQQVKAVAINFKAEEKELITGIRIKLFPCTQFHFSGVNAKIDLYKGSLDKFAADFGEPIYTQECYIEYPDYQTIEFDQDVIIKKGEDYYVTVTFSNYVDYCLDGEVDFGYIVNEAHGKRGETFIKIMQEDAKLTWYDTAVTPLPTQEGPKTDTSACIKVLTRIAPKTPVQLLIEQYNEILGIEKTCVIITMAMLIFVFILAKKGQKI